MVFANSLPISTVQYRSNFSIFSDKGGGSFPRISITGRKDPRILEASKLSTIGAQA